MIPRVSAVHVPGVTSTIDAIEVRTSEVEVVTMGIACINAKVPEACIPVERTVEIGGIQVELVLPVQKDIAQVEVTALPIDSVEIVLGINAHEVVKVYLVGCFILLFREVELVGHLVGEEQSLLTGLLVAHGVGRCYESEQCHKGGHHLLHNGKLFSL